MFRKEILTHYLFGSVILIVVLFVFRPDSPLNPLGAIIEGQAYYSTTTNAVVSGPVLLKGDRGSVGSITITKAGSGAFTLYNATTSNVNLRTGQKATTTIILGVIPANPTVGTYVFDSTFTDGLLIDFINTMGTSTITWR